MRKLTVKILMQAVEKLNLCYNIIAEISEDELSVAEKLPGNLKQSQKYVKMKGNVDNLKLAAKQILNAVNLITSACER